MPYPPHQVRAVVTYDKAVVLKSRRDSENQGIIAPMLRVGDYSQKTYFSSARTNR